MKAGLQGLGSELAAPTRHIVPDTAHAENARADRAHRIRTPDLDQRWQPSRGQGLVTGHIQNHDTQILEAMSQHWVSHPNVMPLKEIGIKPDYMYLVMPRAMGGVVRNTMQQDPHLLTDEVIATILYQAAEGLEALDAAGIHNYNFLDRNLLLMNPLTASGVLEIVIAHGYQLHAATSSAEADRRRRSARCSEWHKKKAAYAFFGVLVWVGC